MTSDIAMTSEITRSARTRVPKEGNRIIERGREISQEDEVRKQEIRKQSGRCKKEEWQKKSLPNKPQISPFSICTYKVGGEGTHLVRS